VEGAKGKDSQHYRTSSLMGLKDDLEAKKDGKRQRRKLVRLKTHSNEPDRCYSRSRYIEPCTRSSSPRSTRRSDKLSLQLGELGCVQKEEEEKESEGELVTSKREEEKAREGKELRRQKERTFQLTKMVGRSLRG